MPSGSTKEISSTGQPTQICASVCATNKLLAVGVTQHDVPPDIRPDRDTRWADKVPDPRGTRGGPHTIEELATTLGDNPRTLRKHLDVPEGNNMVDAHKRPDGTEFGLADEAPELLE